MSIKSAPLYYPPAQRKVRKERSDFAEVETCLNICRGEQRSPVFRICIISAL
ncbi:hypothetical protein [Ruminococcus sp.]|uniref:hypothetical protein n=1 Tax=Ruminococcus sp. TaxID=41978 RepID=UPI000AABF01E